MKSLNCVSVPLPNCGSLLPDFAKVQYRKRFLPIYRDMAVQMNKRLQPGVQRQALVLQFFWLVAGERCRIARLSPDR